MSSYSEVVNKVQGNRAEAKKLIIELIKEHEELDVTISKKEDELKTLKLKQSDLWHNVFFVIKHADIECPVVINDTENKKLTLIKDERWRHYENTL